MLLNKITSLQLSTSARYEIYMDLWRPTLAVILYSWNFNPSAGIIPKVVQIEWSKHQPDFTVCSILRSFMDNATNMGPLISRSSPPTFLNAAQVGLWSFHPPWNQTLGRWSVGSMVTTVTKKNKVKYGSPIVSCFSGMNIHHLPNYFRQSQGTRVLTHDKIFGMWFSGVKTLVER